MFCPKCGKKLPDTAMFCGNCGHKLEKSGNRKQNSVKAEEPEKKFWRIPVKKLAIAVSIVVLGCYVLWLLDYYDLIHIRHDWQEATCTEPSICSRCEKINGEALGHIWEKATCTKPKTCKECGETEGGSLGGEHDWKGANCTQPATCKKCGETKGESWGGHDWEEATCMQPKTCKKCGETEGESLGGKDSSEGHDWKEATCTQPKTCKRCKKTEGESWGGHDWEEATCTQSGTCKRCGETEEALGHDCADATCMELRTCNRCHMEVSLGRHRMDSSTGMCEICGKELRVALDIENWEEYLETAGHYGGHGTYIRRIMGPLGLYIDYYHFEDVVVEIDCEVIESSGISPFDRKVYSIRGRRHVRLKLTRDGSGDFAGKIQDKELTGNWNVKSISGFVIIDEDEYEKRGITEREE